MSEIGWYTITEIGGYTLGEIGQLKKATQKIAETEKKEEADRKRIAGEFVLEKMKKDSSFKIWFNGEINTHLKDTYEKNLFGLLSSDKQELGA